MKAINLIAAFLLTSTIMFASNDKAPALATTTLSGQVIDKTTGEVLAGVKIELDEKVVYSDLEGNFKINNIVPGSYKINTSLISYNSSSVEIDFKLHTNDVEIELNNN